MIDGLIADILTADGYKGSVLRTMLSHYQSDTAHHFVTRTDGLPAASRLWCCANIIQWVEVWVEQVSVRSICRPVDWTYYIWWSSSSSPAGRPDETADHHSHSALLCCLVIIS